MNNNYDRRKNLAKNQEIKTDGRSKLIIFSILIFIALLVTIILWPNEPKDENHEKNPEIIIVNGMEVRLIPAEKQITEIKNEKAEIESCSYDSAKIFCVDILGDKTEYTREYQQNFVY